MSCMGQRRRGYLHASDASGWTRGPAIQPKLSQFLGKLLACCRPIEADVITKLLYVTLEIKLVLLEP